MNDRVNEMMDEVGGWVNKWNGLGEGGWEREWVTNGRGRRDGRMNEVGGWDSE